MADACAHVYESDTGEAVPCPHPAHEGTSRCVFHIPMSQREAHGVDDALVREKFLSAIRSDDPARKRFHGAEFGTLDLSSSVVEGGDTETVELVATTVHGVLNLSDASVRQPLSLQRCSVGAVYADGADFERRVAVNRTLLGVDEDRPGGVRFAGARFGRGGYFSRTEFFRTADFGTADFESKVLFEHVGFDTRARFVGADFDQVFVDDCTFSGPAEFDRATFTDDAVFSRDEFTAEASFTGVDADGRIALRGLTVERFDATDADFAAGLEVTDANDGAEFDLSGARVAGGLLDQPPDGTTLYDLSEATLGDVDLGLDEHSQFERYHCCRTDFEGFQFTAYRDTFREFDWLVHTYLGDTDHSTSDLELTYLRAKIGASAVGDNDAASAFSVREMRARRRRYAERARDASRPPRARAVSVFRGLSNEFLRLTCGYGERPQRVILTSLAVVTVCALLYPLEAVGGVETAARELTYAGDSPLTALATSLYFSVVTFTTLGYGDLTPAGELPRLLAAGEAVSGAFLTALFVFTLGRRVTR